MEHLLAASLLALMSLTGAAAAPDYAALYQQGTTFASFLESARSRTNEWKQNYATAAIGDDMVARVRALPARRKLLVVAEASCSDSVSTIPFLAKLVESAPDALDLRIVDRLAGRTVMEEHRTPDGRAATPTVVVLDEHGKFMAAWSERPADLQTWYIEKKPVLTQGELLAQKMKWYAADGGRSTVAEVVALLTR
jgi:hypothetical protein